MGIDIAVGLQWFYLKAKDELIKLGCKQSKYDEAVFIYHKDHISNGFISLHVDDGKHGGTETFYRNVMEPLKRIFIFGSIMNKESFKYVGWNVRHQDSKIIIDQQDYVQERLQLVTISPERLANKHSPVNSEEQGLERPDG